MRARFASGLFRPGDEQLTKGEGVSPPATPRMSSI